VALLGEGIHDVTDAVLRHTAYLETTGGRVGRDRDRLRAEVLALLGDGLLAGFLRSRADADLGAELERVFARRASPRQAVQDLLSRTS
jgi:putative protein kinase ArgK-like GTPase of G3E family